MRAISVVVACFVVIGCGGTPASTNQPVQSSQSAPSTVAATSPEALPSGAGRGLYKPAYSPDGSSIVFGCDGKLCTMAADGSNQKVIVEAPGIELNHFDRGPPTAGN